MVLDTPGLLTDLVTDGPQKNPPPGAPSGAVALMGPLEVVELEEPVQRRLQLAPPTRVPAWERHTSVPVKNRSCGRSTNPLVHA